jgi:hypothetical protein
MAAYLIINNKQPQGANLAMQTKPVVSLSQWRCLIGSCDYSVASKA